MNKIMPYVEKIISSDEAFPLSIQINVTNSCSSKCYFCRKYEWPKFEIAIDDLKKIVDEITEDNKCESIVLSGGDPLNYKYFIEAINLIKSKGVSVGVFTSLITKNKKYLECLCNVDKVRVSLDAAGSRTYGRIRGVDAFELVYKNLFFISNYRSGDLEKIKINTVVTKDNINELHRIEDIAKAFNCEIGIYPVHTWKELESENLHFDIEEELAPNCYIPKFHAIIDADLYVYPCCRMMNDNGDFNYSRINSPGRILYDVSLRKLMCINYSRFYNAPTENKICKICDRYRSINNDINDYIKNKKEIFI